MIYFYADRLNLYEEDDDDDFEHPELEKANQKKSIENHEMTLYENKLESIEQIETIEGQLKSALEA